MATEECREYFTSHPLLRVSPARTKHVSVLYSFRFCFKLTCCYMEEDYKSCGDDVGEIVTFSSGDDAELAFWGGPIFYLGMSRRREYTASAGAQLFGVEKRIFGESSEFAVSTLRN